jgi:hypothetical protein
MYAVQLPTIWTVPVSPIRFEALFSINLFLLNYAICAQKRSQRGFTVPVAPIVHVRSSGLKAANFIRAACCRGPKRNGAAEENQSTLD